MTKPLNNSRPWRLLWLFPVAVLAVLSIVASGGSGGGDGPEFDDADDLPLVILPTYNFFLANLEGDALLTAAVGSLFTASVDIDGLFPGSLDLVADVNNNVSFMAYSVRPSARFDLTVTSNGVLPIDGTFTVIVTEEINAMIDDAPGSGAFNVLTPTETVAVSILGNEVQLSLNGGAAVVYNTWDEFTALVDDDTKEAWQRRAAMAAGSFEFIVELFFQIADVLDELEAVTFANPLIEVCDMFTAPPPDGILAQGDTTVTWLGSGELLPGDNFTWQFNQCWIDASDDVIDGVISLENYTETVDTNTNTLFEIGFGGVSNQPGGIIFDLTIAETERVRFQLRESFPKIF
jgi:hypothetical protein